MERIKISSAKYSQIIKRIRVNEIAPIYFLSGSDIFLQDFFLKELKPRFLKESGEIISFSMEIDSPKDLITEFYSQSLFALKRILLL